METARGVVAWAPRCVILGDALTRAKHTRSHLLQCSVKCSKQPRERNAQPVPCTEFGLRGHATRGREKTRGGEGAGRFDLFVIFIFA